MGFADTVIDGLSALTELAPYHLLSYSALLGTELYQSFVVTKVAYRALPMSSFASLQKRIFPAYFNSQSLLMLLTLITVPPYGPVSLVQDLKSLIPLLLAALPAGLNWAVFGPRTKKAMLDRVHQEIVDGIKYNDPEINEAMRLINRAFSKAHAISIHLNLVSIVATLWYGVRLAARFKLE
jgi:hypothetical protein